MSIKEKLELSADIKRFTLFKEGLFFKCYNEDAILFAKLVKPYKVNTKYIKNIGADVVSLGFPVSETENGKLSFEKMCAILGSDSYDLGVDKVSFYPKTDIKQGYEKWCESLVRESSTEYASKPIVNLASQNTPSATELIALIKNFDLANSTPMQALNFVQHLKQLVEIKKESNGNF